MEFNWLIFPSPDTSYNYDRINGELIFIPKNQEVEEKQPNNNDIQMNNNPNNEPENDDLNENVVKHIPCLYLKSTNNSICPKFAIFFHGNAEDINLAFEILNHIRFTLCVNVIAPEYPGYGIYPGKPHQDLIYEDSIIVYEYLTNHMKISPNNIIVFGRSLGTAPSIYLSSQCKVSALILISPLLSIRHVVKDILGKLISYCFKNIFENIDMVDKVTCPILIIHGQNDVLIKYYHSTELYNRAKVPCELILPENMDHNEFDFFQEFSEPLLDFISRNAIFANTEACVANFPKELYGVPEIFKRPYKQWNFLTKLLKKFSIA